MHEKNNLNQFDFNVDTDAINYYSKQRILSCGCE